MAKRWKCGLLAGCLLLALGAGNAAADEETAAGNNNLAKMGRGLVNIATCFLEVPRCLIYRNSQVPVLGVIAGTCEGAGMTGVRAFAGAADFLSVGFMGDSIYRIDPDFREWVWESPWVPRN